jgi:hypothetical protein
MPQRKDDPDDGFRQVQREAHCGSRGPPPREPARYEPQIVTGDITAPYASTCPILGARTKKKTSKLVDSATHDSGG